MAIDSLVADVVYRWYLQAVQKGQAGQPEILLMNVNN